MADKRITGHGPDLPLCVEKGTIVAKKQDRPLNLYKGILFKNMHASD